MQEIIQEIETLRGVLQEIPNDCELSTDYGNAEKSFQELRLSVVGKLKVLVDRM